MLCASLPPLGGACRVRLRRERAKLALGPPLGRRRSRSPIPSAQRAWAICPSRRARTSSPDNLCGCGAQIHVTTARQRAASSILMADSPPTQPKSTCERAQSTHTTARSEFSRSPGHFRHVHSERRGWATANIKRKLEVRPHGAPGAGSKLETALAVGGEAGVCTPRFLGLQAARRARQRVQALRP